MPKISEPTVVQHRAVQHRAVLEAAEQLIMESGGKVPTIAEVAAEVGLARSSVYLYVASREDMVIQLLLEAIPAWLKNLTAELDTVGSDPADRLAAYVRVTLRLFVEGSHGPLMAAAGTMPATFTDERVQQSHNGLEPALLGLLGEEITVIRPLVDAMINRGAEMITGSDADFDMVSVTLQRMARAALCDPNCAPWGPD